jgi:drug/metabolite transporter (DMT)-like permease
VDLERGFRRRRFVPAISVKGFIAVAVWGASFVATRMALRSFDPFGLIAIRLWMGALMLVLVVGLRGGSWLPARADRPMCVGLGLVLAAHLLIQAYGLTYTSAIHTGWIVGFMPVTIALGAYLLRKQRLNAVGWSGVALGTSGVLIVTMKSTPDFAHAHFGDVLQLGSCLTWTVYTLAAGGPVARNGALRVTALAMIVAAGLATIATLWTGVRAGPVTREAVLAVAFLGLLCSGVAYYLWSAAVDDQGPARVGALLYVEPFVTLITAAWLLNEDVTPTAIVGGVCVLAGVWLVARGAAAQGRAGLPGAEQRGIESGSRR